MMPTHKAITSGMSRLSAARDVVTVPAKSAIGTAYSNTIRFSVEASFDPKSCRLVATKPSKKVNTIGRSALKIVSSMLPACPCLHNFHFASPALITRLVRREHMRANRNILQQRSLSLNVVCASEQREFLGGGRELVAKVWMRKPDQSLGALCRRLALHVCPAELRDYDVGVVSRRGHRALQSGDDARHFALRRGRLACDERLAAPRSVGAPHEVKLASCGAVLVAEHVLRVDGTGQINLQSRVY